MESNILNRMAGVPGKRGRPSNAELAARSAPVPVENVQIQLPPLAGITCPCCGRAMVPRITHTEGSERYVKCSFTGRRMVISYDASGRPSTARLL